MMFSDLTRRVTMQNLFSDGGFSSSGITEGLVNELMKNRETDAGAE
jgi:enoyl-[acyl-carrier protein] reductase I